MQSAPGVTTLSVGGFARPSGAQMVISSTHEPTESRAPHAFRRVLVASALDEAGARAALRAARLPLASSARVAVLHVVPPWAERDAAGRSSTRTRRELGLVAAAASSAARRAGDEGRTVVPLLSEGSPATEIVRAAWRERAELIVVGAPAPRRVGVGSPTLSRVTRHADLPLLVARAEPRAPYGHVLCAVDRSVTAVDTIVLATRLRGGAASRLTLLHAYHVPFEPWLSGEAHEVEDEAREHVRALARAIGDELGEVRTLVRPGEPELEILRAAARGRPDLIVVGTHGRSGLTHAIRGSVAEWVIASAPCDVAVARPHRLTLDRAPSTSS
jgi:nucleotide-binding universal stress UspA family protein